MADIKALGIIPARYDSSRFPGKPLADIAGKSMIQRVYEQSQKANLHRVIVATDDQRIFDEVSRFGGEAVMTKATHQSGTDRCHEALAAMNDDCDVVVNIQGDEPFIQPEQINALVHCFDQANVHIATLIKKAVDLSEVKDPNRVKVVVNKREEAIYFSRSAVPYLKNWSENQWLEKHVFWIHIGLYAYRPHILDEITRLSFSSLEKAESLEQLRWIENGYKIKVAVTEIDSDPIDHPEDLQKMLARIDAGDYIY